MVSPLCESESLVRLPRTILLSPSAPVQILLQLGQQIQGLDGGENVHIGHAQLVQHGLAAQVAQRNLLVMRGRADGDIGPYGGGAVLQLLQDLPARRTTRSGTPASLATSMP